VNQIVFLVLALLAVVAALTVVLHRNPVHSACALVVTLFLISVFFVALDAQLIAALQVIVYAGAIVVLLLFVIMLLNLQFESRALGSRWLVAAAAVGCLLLLAPVAAGVWRATVATGPAVAADFGYTTAVARLLFTTYLVPFELTSLLLLIAVVGAVALTKRSL
jgi:NADH-quinone oxidoreductase subunit J